MEKIEIIFFSPHFSFCSAVFPCFKFTELISKVVYLHTIFFLLNPLYSLLFPTTLIIPLGNIRTGQIYARLWSCNSE